MNIVNSKTYRNGIKNCFKKYNFIINPLNNTHNEKSNSRIMHS